MKNNSYLKEACYFKIVWGGPFKADPEGLILVSDDTKGFNEYLFHEAKPVEGWPEGITFYVKGKKHEDYVVVGLQWMVVSEKVRQVFEKLEVKGIQFLPVHIVLEDTGKEIGPYWELNVVQEVDALDWEHTRWVPSERDPRVDEYPMLDILKVALRREPLQGLDIFRLNIKGKGDTRVFISKRVKQNLERAKATTGFKFSPVAAY